jgi:ABC-type uncharacterized transport system ATPase subunit
VAGGVVAAEADAVATEVGVAADAAVAAEIVAAAIVGIAGTAGSGCGHLFYIAMKCAEALKG